MPQPDWHTRFVNETPGPGTVSCVWLGQAGYLFKTDRGTTLLLDPYLTDYAEMMWGLKRIVPPAFDYTDWAPDILLSTHWHEDHLDLPVVKHYIGQPGVTLVGSFASIVRSTSWGWPNERAISLSAGESVDIGDVSIEATFARHETPEAPAPDAIGFLLTLSGRTIWNVGDTEYDARVFPPGPDAPEVMITPINGVGGNLDVDEAALLAWKTQPAVVIPNHYNMWAPESFGPGATLDPEQFKGTLIRLGGGPTVRVLSVGEVVTL